MEADFSGWATKALLRCTDGRTIMPDAFAHQDSMQVPLVWQHGHTDPENVLGHVLLENRKEGVYAYGFFNETPKAKHTALALDHGDFDSLSIWANQLQEHNKQVFHGAIREVSLVLSGANPGARIENISIRHGDGGTSELDEEAIIHTGLTLDEVNLDGDDDDDDIRHADDDGETIQDVYESMSEKQKQVLHYMVGQALEDAKGSGEDVVAQSGIADNPDASIKDIYDSMTPAQKEVLHFMVGEALEEAAELQQSDDPKGNEMKHNVFENGQGGAKPAQHVLSHDEMKEITTAGQALGSLKAAVEEYGLQHGIDDIDILFPEAKTIANTPELFKRRTEWVAGLLSGVNKSPFSRIKTMSADLTPAEARAKGYITGSLKKEEFFRVSKRVTTPQTIYKKQKLDRDDIVDITDFDVVAWLKGEMRLMLDEEIARAILVGDGRAADDEDKILEDHVRPVATDHEVYTTTITVNLDDSNSSVMEAMDHIVLNRRHLRGSGLPTMYTTETNIARMLLLKDNDNRKIYKNLDEVASDLRVSSIVSVEILEEYEDIFAILFNPTDYVVGADRGGAVSMFDDFDIDYNQYKYLIETRISGALTKLKSAMVVRKTDAENELVVPNEPAFDGTQITITDQTGVVYRNDTTDAVMNAAGSPYAVPEGETILVTAEPAAGYYFADSENDAWPFTNEA